MNTAAEPLSAKTLAALVALEYAQDQLRAKPWLDEGSREATHLFEAAEIVLKRGLPRTKAMQDALRRAANLIADSLLADMEGCPR
jgi:hypothetical protein